MTYPITRVSPDTSTQLEQLGTKEKCWFQQSENIKFLFKVGRPNTGENWAEKVCCEIAQLLGLPHAEYELALWGDKQGVISPSLVPENGRLILGNELLAKVDKSYETAARYRTTQHVLRRVIAVLQQPTIGTPIGWVCPPQVSDGNRSRPYRKRPLPAGEGWGEGSKYRGSICLEYSPGAVRLPAHAQACTPILNQIYSKGA